MKNECNIIRDILPLYLDEIASVDTVSFVEDHLKQCESCREEFEKLKAPTILEDKVSDIADNNDEPLRAVAKKWKRTKKFVVVSIISFVFIIALLGSCFVSYYLFWTPNPFSASYGVIMVAFTDTEYVVLQNSPKVLLTKPSNGEINKYMESQGYIEIEEEQMGACRVFTNGEETVQVLCRMNGYYAKWRWLDDK